MSDSQDVQAVGGINVLRSAWFTRPANTTAYAAGDVISDNATTSKIIKFDECARGRGSGIIVSAMLVDGANQSTKLDADLFIFTKQIDSYGGDNAAFTPTDEELGTLIGVVQFPSSSWRDGDATSGVGGNCVNAQAVTLPFRTLADANGSDDALYGVLVARNAYTPVSVETFRVILGIAQD